MAMEVQISLLVGACTEETRNIVIGVLEDLGYEILPENVDYSHVFALLKRDKKRALKSIAVPVLIDIGRYEIREFQLKEYEKYAAESLNFLKGFKEAKMSTKLKVEIYDDLDVLESSGRFNDAENLVTRFLEKDPTNEKMNIVLARLYSRQGKNSAALRVIDEILQINPENNEAISMRREFTESEDRVEPEEEAAGVESLPSETIIKIDQDVYRIKGIEEDEYVSREEEGELKEEEIIAEEPAAEEMTDLGYVPDEDREKGIPVYTLAMAEILLKEGKRDESLEVLDEILGNDPENESALLLKDKIQFLRNKEGMLNKYTEVLNKFLQKIVEAYR
jgi:tetratricopeptide (TPR) repeat protein